MKAIKSDTDDQYYDPEDLEFVDGILSPKSGSIPIDQPNSCGCFAEDGYPCPHEVELAGLEGVEDGE